MILLAANRDQCFMCSHTIDIGDGYVRRKVSVGVTEKTPHPDEIIQQRKYYPQRLAVSICLLCAAEEEKKDE